MTATAFTGRSPLPPYPVSSLTANGTVTLDAAGAPDNGVAGDYVAWVLQAPATGTIDKVTIRLASTTATGGNATLSCRIFSVDASGDPDDDAVYGSCAQSDYSVTGTDDNTFVTFSSLACSATKGDVICVTVWLSAIVTTCTCNVVTNAITWGTGNPPQGFPYQTNRTTGTGAGTHSANVIGMSLEYSGNVFYQTYVGPCHTVLTENLDSDGTLQRQGNRIILPMAVTVDGFWAVLDNDTDTTVLKLYDTDGTTELATGTLVSANRNGTAGAMYHIPFAGASVNLTANTASPYRVVVTTNNTSATAVGVRGITVNTAAELNQLPLGTNCYYTSHNGSAWSDTTTQIAQIGLLVSKFDDGLGGGVANYRMGV